jgi:hypothetical protein
LGIQILERTAVHESLLDNPLAARAPEAHDCQVLELRQYTLHPGRRDDLVALFDREFVETQEALGVRVVGQFRDLDDPDRFVWLRGFADMAARRRGLEAFYGGPVWAKHRHEANATMVDSDDVLLLRPAWPGAGLKASAQRRAPRGASLPAPGRVLALVIPLREPACDVGLSLCRIAGTQVLHRAGVNTLGWYSTESAVNDFPGLPVREGEHVVVAIAVFDDAPALDAFVAEATWEREAGAMFAPWQIASARQLRLAPTARSALRGGSA